MTLPIERTYAITNTREFLRDLLDPKKTPKVPKAVRTRAYWCLRHYPADFYMEDVANKSPDIFGKLNEENENGQNKTRKNGIQNRRSVRKGNEVKK